MSQTTKKTERGYTLLDGVEVPPQLNTVDMNERGERSGALEMYGNAYQLASVYAAMKAWEVVERYCINADYAGREPTPSHSGGPVYFCKFKDGLWRYASFKGLSAPPWFHVPLKGYPGKTGKEAHLRYLIEGKEERLNRLQEDIDDGKAELAELQRELFKELGEQKTQ